MKRLLAWIVFAIDRRLPRARVGGRESGEAYSRWEYEVGKSILDSYGGRFGPLQGESVLDIGCGLGGKTVAYAEAGARVVGVDISRENLQSAVRFASRCPGVAFVAGDAERLPFAEGSFDLVIANDSLEHFADPGGAVAELGRVVRPGGSILLFFTPWRSPLGSHLYDYIRTPWCHLLFPEWLLRALLERATAARGSGDPAGEAERLMGEYHTELNRITVAGYRRIVEENTDIEVRYEELRPPKFHFLAPLARLPVIGEMFTGTVVAVLRRAPRELPGRKGA